MTAILLPEKMEAVLNAETISPLQKVLLQGFQYRHALESGDVSSVSELAQKENQEYAFLISGAIAGGPPWGIIEAIM